MTKEWAAKVVQGWEDWIDEAARTGDLIGEAALGAGTGQVLAVDTTSVNLYQLCYAAVSHAQRSSGGRSVIITDVANFPTDRYVLQGLAKQLHCRLVLIDDSEGHEFVTPESLHATISEVGAQTVALVSLSVVQYRSGALHDVERLTTIVKDAGAMLVWDASHAVGLIDLRLDAWGVDLAVGCTYKYCNAGPGAPGWLYVNVSRQSELQVPIQGWFAQKDQFEMGRDFERASDIRGFQIATPSIISMRCIQASMQVIKEAGIRAISNKAEAGTDFMLRIFDEWLVPLGFSSSTPRQASQRGGHITLHHPEAYQISVALRDVAKVVADYRKPDALRVAMSPLSNSFVEVMEGLRRLRDLVRSGQHRKTKARANSRVT
mmetsp:Transcript_5672/g.20628  ORF Transcript_5672/g.20628 Transcript_5672/m.20628 type:complete len:376 (-) Transcript_5672:31-1158(-)